MPLVFRSDREALPAAAARGFVRVVEDEARLQPVFLIVHFRADDEHDRDVVQKRNNDDAWHNVPADDECDQAMDGPCNHGGG